MASVDSRMCVTHLGIGSRCLFKRDYVGQKQSKHLGTFGTFRDGNGRFCGNFCLLKKESRIISPFRQNL